LKRVSRFVSAASLAVVRASARRARAAPPVAASCAYGLGQRGEPFMLRPLSFSLVATLGLLALLAIAACGKAEEESPATGQLAAPVTTSAAQNACSKVVSEISVGLSSASPAYQISSA